MVKPEEIISRIVSGIAGDGTNNDFTLGLSRQEVCILAEWYEDIIHKANEGGGIVHPAMKARAEYLREFLTEEMYAE